MVDLSGAAALVIIISMFVFTNEYSMWLCRGGILLLSRDGGSHRRGGPSRISSWTRLGSAATALDR